MEKDTETVKEHFETYKDENLLEEKYDLFNLLKETYKTGENVISAVQTNADLREKLISMTNLTTKNVNQLIDWSDIKDHLEDYGINDEELMKVSIPSLFDDIDSLDKEFEKELKSHYIDYLIRISFISNIIDSSKPELEKYLQNPERRGKSKLNYLNGNIDFDKEIAVREENLTKTKPDLLPKRKNSLEEIKNKIKPLYETIRLCQSTFQDLSKNKLEKESFIKNQKVKSNDFEIFENINICQSQIEQSSLNKQPKINQEANDDFENLLSSSFRSAVNNNNLNDTIQDVADELPDYVNDIIFSFDGCKIRASFYVKIVYLYGQLEQYKESAKSTLHEKLTSHLSSIKINIKSFDINFVLEELKKAIVSEGFSDFLGKVTSIQEIYKQIEKKQTLKLLMELCFDCKNLLNDIEPIFLYAIKKYLADAQDYIDIITGKQVIFLMGCTGTGKTSILLYLNEVKFKRDGEELLPIYSNRKDLKEFVAKDTCQSVTRFVKVPCKPSYKHWYICDSAGWDDTSTINIEIANNISLIRAMLSAEEVVPVLVISEKQLGDRLQYINQIPELLSRLIKNKKLENLERFHFIANKISTPEAQKKFKKKIEDIKTEERVFIDKETKDMCEEIIDKLSTNDAFIDLENPEKREDMLKKFIKSKTVIKDAKNVFKITVSENANPKVKDYVSKLKSSIKELIENSNYQLALVKLNEYFEFTTIITSYVQEYKMALVSFSDIFDKNYQKTIRLVDNSLSNLNSLNEADLEDVYQYLFLISDKSYFELEKILDISKNESNRDIIKITAHVNGLLECLIHKITFMNIQDIKANEIESINLTIHKLNVLSDYDNKKTVNFSIAKTIISALEVCLAKIDKLHNTLVDEIIGLNYDKDSLEVNLYLQKLNTFVVNFEKLNFSIVKNFENNIQITKLKQMLNKLLDDLERLYLKKLNDLINNINSNQIEQLIKIDSNLTETYEKCSNYYFSNLTNESIFRITNVIKDLFEKFKQEILSKFQKNSESSNQLSGVNVLDDNNKITKTLFLKMESLSKLLIINTSELKYEVGNVKDRILIIVNKSIEEISNMIEMNQIDKWNIGDLF